jgi:3-oxoacyl-[acyl-carrier protein] reductase
MTGQFEGRRILLTGGTKGIGRAIALAFAREGGSVVACYREDRDAADALEIALKEIGGVHHVVRADVAVPEDVEHLFAVCREELGELDAVVHNAGAISHVPFDKLTPQEWHRVLDTNLTGAFLVAQHSLPLLSEGSSIVFVGSKVATVGVPLRAHYTAAKAGLVGLTRSLCKELGPRGIRVNVVAPGVIETEEAAKLPPEVYRRYQSISSLGRLGTVEEVAAAVLFASSRAAGYLTGEVINVDGGA